MAAKMTKNTIMKTNIRLALSLFSLVIFAITAASCDRKAEVVNNLYPTPPICKDPQTELVTLLSGNLLYNSFLTTDGSSIFYQSKNQNELVKSDYDGGNPKVLSTKSPLFISVVNDVVFFLENESQGNIYKVDKEGKGESLVLDVTAAALISTPEYLFYIDTNDGFVYRILHDGSKKTLILDKPSSQILLYKSNLYIVVEDDNSGFYIFPSNEINRDDYKKDTTLKNVTFNKIQTMFYGVNFSDNGVFYTKIVNEKNVIAIQKDKKRPRDILKKSVMMPFITSGKYLYYIDSNDNSRLYRMNTDEPSSTELVADDSVFSFVVCGNSIYYRRENSFDIFRVSIAGGVSSQIT
jgi:hypothetical protein